MSESETLICGEHGTGRVTVVDLEALETRLAHLVEQVERGEEVVLARAGTPIARIVALPPARTRVLGQWRGRVRMAGFDDPLTADELARWSGE
jgi:prevent-host-death family protein